MTDTQKARVKERATERNAETLAISIRLIEMVAKDMDALLIGIKEMGE